MPNKIVSLRNILFMFLCVSIIFWLVCYFTYFTFVLQPVKFTMLLLARSFSGTSGLKRMPLHFQMNINNDLLENDMDLEDDILYNLHRCYFSSDERWWSHTLEGPTRKHPLFFQVLIDALLKPKGIVAELTASTNIYRFFILIYFWNITSIPTNMLSLIILLIFVYYLFHKSLYTCLPKFEASSLGIGRPQRCFGFCREAFDYTIPFSYWQRHQFWRLGWFSNS